MTKNLFTKMTAFGIILLISGCGMGYGKKLDFNGGDLFYTSSVTKEEATKLGNYLTKDGFFDGNHKSTQLNKSGNTFEFRMVVKKGIDSDPAFINLFKELAKLISTNVFQGNKVEIHLCDESFKTLRVIVPIG